MSKLINKTAVEVLARTMLPEDERTNSFIAKIKDAENDFRQFSISSLYLKAIDVVSELTSIDSDTLISSKKGITAVYKYCAINYLRRLGFSLQVIAKTIGRTHASVINALRNYQNIMDGYGNDGGYLRGIYVKFNEYYEI